MFKVLKSYFYRWLSHFMFNPEKDDVVRYHTDTSWRRKTVSDILYSIGNEPARVLEWGSVRRDTWFERRRQYRRFDYYRKKYPNYTIWIYTKIL